jgi:hypothetical protein
MKKSAFSAPRLERDELALVVSAHSIAVASAFAENNEIRSCTLPLDGSWTDRLREWRVAAGGAPAPNLETTFALTGSNMDERTRLLAVEELALELSDDELNDYLARAAASGLNGGDGEPLFASHSEKPYLEEMACAFLRTPDESGITATEVRRESVREAGRELLRLAGLEVNLSLPEEAQPELLLRIETPSRALARYYLHHRRGHNKPGGKNAAIAFWLVTDESHHIALWSDSLGLFSEFGEMLFADSSDSAENVNPASDFSSLMQEVEGEYENFGAFESNSAPASAWGGNEEYHSPDATETTDRQFVINRALEELFLKIKPHNFDEYNCELERVVWIAAPKLSEQVKTALETANAGGQFFEEMSGDLYQTIAEGLLLGAGGGGESDALVETVNLADDVRVRASRAATERQQLKVDVYNRARRNAVLAMTLPLIVAFAVLCGSWVDMIRTGYALDAREAAANAKTEELKPLLQALRKYEADFGYYQSFIEQIIKKRASQGVPISLFQKLDATFPGSLDASFHLTDVKLTNKGGLEIIGLARDETAVYQFVRELETSSDESGKKLFVGLQPELRRGGDQLSASGSPFGSGALGAATSGFQVSNLPAGVIAFQIKGAFTPIGEAGNNPAAVRTVAAPGSSGNNPPAAATTNTAPQGGKL